MLSWRTKLPKFECLKNLGNSSLPNLSAEGTECQTRRNDERTRTLSEMCQRNVRKFGSDLPRNESPSSDHLIKSSVVGSDTMLTSTKERARARAESETNEDMSNESRRAGFE